MYAGRSTLVAGVCLELLSSNGLDCVLMAGFVVFVVFVGRGCFMILLRNRIGLFGFGVSGKECLLSLWWRFL